MGTLNTYTAVNPSIGIKQHNNMRSIWFLFIGGFAPFEVFDWLILTLQMALRKRQKAHPQGRQ